MATRRWFKIGTGLAVSVTTILTLFGFLISQYNFEVNDLTGNIQCDGTFNSPCISEFTIKNPNAYAVDIYNSQTVKLDFSPSIKDYGLFVVDGRCGVTGRCACKLKNGNELGFKGWRCVDFTNNTKVRNDTSYVFRFPAYSTTKFRLVGLKNNPSETIKWGFETLNWAIDPYWFGASSGSMDFVSPTENNGTSNLNYSTIINVSIFTNGTNLSQFTYNWNGTNFTFFDSNLILFYEFNNNSAIGENLTRIVDESLLGNSSTNLVVNVTFNMTNGRYSDGSANFNGNNSYARVNNAKLISNQGYTVSFWVKPYNMTSNQRGPTFRSTFTFYWGNIGTNLFWFMGNGSSYSNGRNTAGVINYGVWQQLTMTYNKTNAYLYVNGAYKDTYAYTSSIINSSISSSGNLCFGTTDSGGTSCTGGWLNGSLDEFILINRSLSSTEVYQLYVMNMNKYNNSQWYMTINQSKNSTVGLDNGTYSFFAYAIVNGIANSTDIRYITFGSADPCTLTIGQDWYLSNLNCNWNTNQNNPGKGLTLTNANLSISNGANLTIKNITLINSRISKIDPSRIILNLCKVLLNYIKVGELS